MNSIKTFLAWLGGIVLAVLAFLSRRKPNPSEKELEESRDRIKEEIKKIDEDQKKLDKKLEEGYTEEELVDYWKDREDV